MKQIMLLLAAAALVSVAAVGCGSHESAVQEQMPEEQGARPLSNEEMNYTPMKGYERVSGEEEPAPPGATP